MFSLGSLGYMVGIMVVNGPQLGWNPGNMVPGRPGKPAESDQNPQSCDIGCSQRKLRIWSSGMVRSLSGMSERPESGTEGSGGPS